MAKRRITFEETSDKTKKHGFIANYTTVARLDAYLNEEILPLTKALFNRKGLRVATSDVSYRVINHWEKAGIITADRTSESGWRSFTLNEFIWLEIVTILRNFGFSIEKIKKVKHNLSDFVKVESGTKKASGYELLEFWSAWALSLRLPVYALVFDNCEIILISEEERILTLEDGTLGNHININVNNILRGIFPDMNLAPRFESTQGISEHEMEVLLMLRTATYTSINLITKDGKIERVEATEIIKSSKSITQLLNDTKYQNIQIQQRDGRITTVQRTRIKKFY